MLKQVKKLLGLIPSDEKYHELKSAGLEQVLGPMHDLVLHAIIPFQIGGAVDLYVFPNGRHGTGFATMELLEPDGSGPKPGAIGTYEMVAFTRLKMPEHPETAASDDPFDQIEKQILSMFTFLGRYSFTARLNPGETCEIPEEDGTATCIVLDEYKPLGKEFYIGKRKHGLLLLIQVHRSEMEYAMQHGGAKLLYKLKDKGFWPYSDLDREPVV